MKKYILLSFILLLSNTQINCGIWNWLFPGPTKHDLQFQVPPEINSKGNSGIISSINVTPVININGEKQTVSHVIDLEKINEEWNKRKTLLANHYSNIHNWVKNHKILSTLSALGSVYLISTAYIKYLESKLSCNNCWSLWLKNKSLDELYLVSQEELSKDLLKSIQNVYTSIENPTDFVTPLIKFIEDTDSEIKNLNQYIYLTNILKMKHINKITFYNKDIAHTASERLNKIKYMKSLFLTWLVDYKVTQHKSQLYRKLLKYIE